MTARPARPNSADGTNGWTSLVEHAMCVSCRATRAPESRSPPRAPLARGSSLPPDVKERLIALAGRHVTTDGVLVLVSRVHRSQAQNRDAARDRLVALLKRAAKPPAKRRPTTPRAAARETRLTTKKRHGAVKRSRSRRDQD